MDPGRKKLTANILEMRGKSHKTKAELDARRTERLILGDTKFTAPRTVKSDRLANEKWNKILDLYDSVPRLAGHITTAMQDQLDTYCILYSRQQKTIKESRRARGTELVLMNNSLLKISAELNKLGKDLLLDFFAQAKVQLPEKEQPADPAKQAGFDV